MAIYLDEQTLPYLKRKFKDVAESDFIGKRVQKLLEDEEARLDKIEACEHHEAEYIGRKRCCGKCQSFFVAGQHETWANIDYAGGYDG